MFLFVSNIVLDTTDRIGQKFFDNMIRAEFAREANAADVDAEDEDLPVAVIADAVNDDNINLGRGVDNINPDPHFLVRVRGHNVEALSSYLFELIREENTCVSVLLGWSPRPEELRWRKLGSMHDARCD